MDILDIFDADLDALRSLIIEVKTAQENSPEEAAAYSALVSLVKQRDSAQEALLHSYATSNSALGRTVLNTLDRASGARSVEAMIECCTNSTTWRSSVMVYCELLNVRIDQERRTLLPVLHDHLNVREREKLGRSYAKIRGFQGGSFDKIDWRKIWATIIDRAG